MPNLSEPRIAPWTAPSAKPAVRAADRALVTESADILAETLAIATAAESRGRVARLLALKEQANDDPDRRDAYQQAADDLRNWAAGVYLAVLREPQTTLATRPKPPRSVIRHDNPHTEESASMRRLAPRTPFPGQRKHRPSLLADEEAHRRLFQGFLREYEEERR